MNGSVKPSPSGLPDLLASLMDKRGWGLRDLQRATALLASDGNAGVAIGTLSNLMNGVSVVPRIPQLWLVAGALDQPPARLLQALGYDTGKAVWPESDQREALLLQIRATGTPMAQRVSRVLALPPDQWPAMDAFLDALEHQREE